MPRVMLLAGLIGSVLAPEITSAQSSAAASLAAIAQRVAGHAGTPSDRTRRLVTWIGSNLEWTWTDYQERTPEQIVRRRAGNCADLAAVLAEMVTAAGMQSRWIAEINVQPRSEDRQARAVEKIKELGPRASVFGLEHNDHRWLEIYDSAQGGWVPADPAVGVVGVHDWEVSRLGFGKRPPPPVPAVAEITKDMLVPFMVTTIDGQHGPVTTDRSAHYLIEEFDRKVWWPPSLTAFMATMDERGAPIIGSRPSEGLWRRRQPSHPRARYRPAQDDLRAVGHWRRLRAASWPTAEC